MSDKIKHTCGEKSYATCVYYELEVPEFSSLTEESCTTVEETIEDIYDLIGEIKTDSDLSELGQQCLTYVTGEERNTLKKVLLKYETEICTLKNKVATLETTAICDISITDCEIDLTGLENQCSNPITKLSELLQYLVNQTIAP